MAVDCTVIHCTCTVCIIISIDFVYVFHFLYASFPCTYTFLYVCISVLYDMYSTCIIIVLRFVRVEFISIDRLHVHVVLYSYIMYYLVTIQSILVQYTCIIIVYSPVFNYNCTDTCTCSALFIHYVLSRNHTIHTCTVYMYNNCILSSL